MRERPAPPIAKRDIRNWAKPVLKYRLLMTLFACVELSKRAVRRDWVGVRARLGWNAPATDHPHIWVHAASNGELASIRPVIASLAKDHAILLTVNTDTGVAFAQSWGLANLMAQLAPLDLPGPTQRMMRRWRVSAHITSESDLWPTRILACDGPVMVLGARLTERSANGWAKFAPLVAQVLGKITFLSAQDAASLERFVNLGLPRERAGPEVDLKTLYTPPKGTPDPALIAAFPRHSTWLAASTHDGEDETILTAHRMAQASDRTTRLILATRHPKRGAAIAALAQEMGLRTALRSQHDDPAPADVYIADTMGDMHLWYALAGRVFVAGSLTDRGGHTPYEPAAFGCALIHGPDVGNFRDAYTRLAQHDAASEIADALTLAQALAALADPEAQTTQGQRAQTALQQDTDLDGVLAQLRHHLPAPPLTGTR